MIKKFSTALLFVLIASSVPVFSQPDNPPDPGVIPIDGGLGIAIAAGAAYGISKFRNRNKQID
jgi:hypothetical protein